MQRFAAAQAEAGVMPGTADGLARDESFGEGPAIMRAMCIDGEKRAAGIYQQDGLVPDMAKQLSIRQLGARDARSEVGTGGLRLFLAHGNPSRYWICARMTVVEAATIRVRFSSQRHRAQRSITAADMGRKARRPLVSRCGKSTAAAFWRKTQHSCLSDVPL
jgi:hypothetical protein